MRIRLARDGRGRDRRSRGRGASASSHGHAQAADRSVGRSHRSRGIEGVLDRIPGAGPLMAACQDRGVIEVRGIGGSVELVPDAEPAPPVAEPAVHPGTADRITEGRAPTWKVTLLTVEDAWLTVVPSRAREAGAKDGSSAAIGPPRGAGCGERSWVVQWGVSRGHASRVGRRGGRGSRRRRGCLGSGVQTQRSGGCDSITCCSVRLEALQVRTSGLRVIGR